MKPARVGPYRLLHQVGSGGMGVVHLALDPDSRAVAVKVLRPHLAADPAARGRLAREGDTLRLVRSPRVAEVLETAADADPPYVVTQFVAAPPLDEHVAAVGPLSGRPLARLGIGLGEALAAIHRAGVVHRDLKPANVLVDEDGPVVIDFGIAQIADDVRLTSTGLVMGTPGYLSPEVLDGAPVSSLGDWWGWAATTLFAATGRPPFGTGPMDAVLARVRRGAPDVEGVAEPFAALLRAALAPDPDDRPTPRRRREVLAAVLAEGAPDDDAPGEVAPAPGVVGGAAAPETIHLTASAPEPSRRHEVPVGATVSLASPPAAAPSRPATRPYPVGGPPAPAPAQEHLTHQTRPLREAYPAASDDPDDRYGPVAAHRAPGVGGGGGAQPPVPRGGGSEVVRDPDADPDAAPEADGPPVVRGRAWVLLALGVVLATVAAVAPVRVAIAAAVLCVLARTVDRSSQGLHRRRTARGARSSDAAVTALSVPHRLFLALVVTVPALLLPVLMGVSAAFITSWALPGDAPDPGATPALVVGAAVALLTAWWGPGGASLRRGVRVSVRAVTPSQGAVALVAGLLALVVLAAVLVVAGPDHVPDWSPLSGPPLGIGAPAV